MPCMILRIIYIMYYPDEMSVEECIELEREIIGRESDVNRFSWSTNEVLLFLDFPSF